MKSLGLSCLVIFVLASVTSTCNAKDITHNDPHQIIGKALDEVVEHLVRRHKRGTADGRPPIGGGGGGVNTAGGGVNPGVGGGAAGDAPWMNKVGGYLDTVGDWLNTVGSYSEPITGIINTATNIINILNERDRAKAEQRRHEMEMELKTETLCDKICVTEWTHWTACTARCGGGLRRRQREHYLPGRCKQLSGFSCRHRTEDVAVCNPGCANGGWPVNGGGSCSCRRGFNGQCCDNDIVCEYPGRPRHGDIDGNFPSKFGNVVSYTCADGFALLGESELVCGEEGWGGQKPQCKHVTCSMPPSPENGRLLNRQDLYVFGEEAVFMCDDGYLLRGPEMRRCYSPLGTDTGRWSGFTPFCQPVKCEQPEIPLYGEMHGTNFRLGANVSFTCMLGFRLKGSPNRRCLPSGSWSGHQPECEVMKCEQPYVPKNGFLVREREEFRVNQFATFDCEEGHHLEGNPVIQCIPDLESGPLGTGGKWDKESPVCQASTCGNPGVPENGFKDGGLYYYPHSVSFSCFNGFVQDGPATLDCQADGTWSGPLPTCTACPFDTFKALDSELDECIPCPPNMHTVSEASSLPEQCICNVGYRLAEVGVCEEITCPDPEYPEFGSILECGNRLGEHCEFDCEAGFIIEKGSSKRTCLESGQWSGNPPVCSACPKNTYKSDSKSCLPCPKNSHTEGDGSSLEQCICDDGYEGAPGGPCGDFDECVDSPCADTCENTVGGYRCVCNTPGWIVDPVDKHLCKLDKTCRNLTETDAPGNGGLVCHWYREENSQQCSVKCNPGYDFPSRINNFESCGPTSGFLWTHEEREEPIEPCIEEFFPEFRMEANSSYFVQACRNLTEGEKNKVKEDYAKMLTEQGVCKKRSTQVCDMKNVGIICGRTLRRKKRGIMEDVEEVGFHFDVKALQFKDKIVDCDAICEFLRIPMDRCSSLCLKTYKRFLRSAVMYSKRQLDQLFGDTGKVRFESVNRHFEPLQGSLETSDVVAMCPHGMVADGEICVPCPAGTMHSRIAGRCVQCPPGMYQPNRNETQCLPCPDGQTSSIRGATRCHACPEGSFGLRCSGACPACANGSCDQATGSCVCESGWTGELCETDINSCTEDSCDPDATCVDVPAPGFGFSCSIIS